MTDVTDSDLAILAADQIPTDAELNNVRVLARQLVQSRQAIARLEAELSAEKKRFTELSERTLPERCSSVGLTSFTLFDGWAVTVKPFSSVSVNKEQEDAALSSLEQLDGGDLVKTEVTVSFGRGELEDAVAFAQSLREQGREPSTKRSVHFQTLNAWFRTKLKKDPLFRLPTELFNTYIGQVAKLTPPREPSDAFPPRGEN